VLFKPNRPAYFDLVVKKSAIKSAIYGQPEFTTFVTGMNAHFAVWRSKLFRSFYLHSKSSEQLRGR
jgi:type I restriction enzyme M protein